MTQYFSKEQRIKELIQNDTDFNADNDLYCLYSLNKELGFIISMIVFLAVITLIILSAIFCLYKQRQKYPIAERSYMLSIFMCISFYCLSIYYPIAYMLLYPDPTNYNNDTMIVLKWIYMWGLYGLYLSYFARSFRIYAAFTERFTLYFDQYHSSGQPIRLSSSIVSNAPHSKFMKIIAYILQRELLFTFIIAIISLLLCIPLAIDQNFYLIPLQNYEGPNIPYLRFLKGDYATAFVYQVTVAIFILQIYILRKVPKHYRFYQESRWNLYTQWSKAILLFFINISYDQDWCYSSSALNIIFNYIQFICMIFVSIFPALYRSMYIPAIPPFPQLDNFYEFIEDEGDHNSLFCNNSFISYLQKRDSETEQNQLSMGGQKTLSRVNLNIYDFYFEFKAALLNIEHKQKLNEVIKMANFYIYNPKDQRYQLEFPANFPNNLQELKNNYNIFSEFSQVKDQSKPHLKEQSEEAILVQNQFIDEMEKLYEHCIKYLKAKVFMEYTKTNAFFSLKEYYQKQNLYQTNLRLLNLHHNI